MSDLHLVDPQGWEYDLQSVYSAYMGYFQLHALPWHDRTWGQFFETFEQFLAFSWPVVSVTDSRTGRAHIVTRMASVAAFLKMIKARFGETLPQVDNMLRVIPLETSQRYLRHVNDWSTYKKLHSALPAVALAAFKARIRAGDPNAIRELWMTRDKTFLAINFECVERIDRSCVEWGYAAIRSSYLQAAGAWPPAPQTNYRKGHYIVSEFTDKSNKASPSLSWQFGETQVIPKAKMPRIIQSVLSVVFVCHGVQGVMQHLDEMKIKLPSNILTLDIAYLERALFTTGERGPMHDRKSGKARLPESLLSLGALLHSFGIAPPCALHNAGNDAFMTLVAFQRMVDPRRPVDVDVNAIRMGKENGNGNGMDKGGVPSGNGRVGRAATVAARFFRPLGGTHPDLGLSKNGHGSGSGDLSQTRVSRRSGDGVDEMGMIKSMKRASMFSSLTSPLLVPADKNKKRTSHGSTSGSGSGPSAWLSPSMTVTGQRRHSVTEKRR